MLTLTAQQLIDLASPNLPIKVFPGREVLPALRQQYPKMEISLLTEFEIHSMVNSGETGGILCEVVAPDLNKKKAETVVLCSLTHLRIKKGEPHYAEIIRYQVKRVKKLKRQNRF